MLYRHPAVLAAAVVAIPDEKWGETPCAFVETRPDAQLIDKEIIEFCRRHGRCGREIRNAPRVALRTRTLEIDEIGHRPKQLVDLFAVESAITIRCLRQSRGPNIFEVESIPLLTTVSARALADLDRAARLCALEAAGGATRSGSPTNRGNRNGGRRRYPPTVL